MLNPEVDLEFNTEQIVKPKKQQLVKHKRKNWKKTDIDDIERGIDDLRQQELTGGARSVKKDSELFFINKEKLALNENGTLPEKKPKRLTLEEKLNNLGCYQNLKPDPNSLPAHVIRPVNQKEETSNRQKKLTDRKVKKQKRLLSAKKREGTYCAKLANELSVEQEETEDFTIKKHKKKSKKLDPEFKENFKERKLNVQLDSVFNKDIWDSRLANDGTDLPTVNRVNEFYLRGKKKIPFLKPKNPLYRESLIPKVETPHPGHSYNPDFDDHQALLLKAHIVELKKYKEEQKLLRRLRLSAKKMSWSEMEKNWLEEMSIRDLFEPKVVSDESEVEEIEDAPVSKRELQRKYDAINNGRKVDTKAKRERKKLLEKIKLRQKENDRLMKIQQNEIYRLKTLKKEVADKMKKESDNAERRKEEETTQHTLGTKRLGRVRFEEEELELKLSEEITGNLRTLKAEGNILRDRYKSLQKRNLIEPRERATGKSKYSKKKFQKKNAYEVTHYIN